MGISETAPGGARPDEGGGLRLPHEGELSTHLPAGADRRRVSGGDLVPLGNTRCAGTHYSRTSDWGPPGAGVRICGKAVVSVWHSQCKCQTVLEQRTT